MKVYLFYPKRLFLSFPICLLLTAIFTFSSSAELHGQLMPGKLTFQSGTVHPFGYSRMDVVWSEFNIPNDGDSQYSGKFFKQE